METFWSKNCKDAKPIQPEWGATLPEVVTLAQMQALNGVLPPLLGNLLEEREFLILNVLVKGVEIVAEEPKSQEDKRRLIVDHRSTHLLHRDAVTRAICSIEPREDTLLVHPQAYQTAQEAGLNIIINSHDALQETVRRAHEAFSRQSGESTVDFSIFLARRLSHTICRLNLNSDIEREFWLTYQNAILEAVGSQYAYRHRHQDPRGTEIRKCLMFKKKLPHFKSVAKSTDLNAYSSSIWAMNFM